ncbi:MAG: hypothetical protein ACRCWW_08610 [Scandinavium sp.]|uniref:hypothetical protein n=1 Tax=Scandinavium sp. TaxID=2830653 RepID=UPI003F2C2291
MDLLPKISDIKNLKDLCKVIVLPLLCACYIVQSPFSLDFDGHVLSLHADDNEALKIIKTVIIFAGKTFFATATAFIIYFLLALLQAGTNEFITLVSIVLLLTFGFTGIFAGDRMSSVIHIEAIWYYASFVTAFFLLSVLEKNK